MTDEPKKELDTAGALIQFGGALITIVVLGAVVVACLWVMWAIVQA